MNTAYTPLHNRIQSCKIAEETIAKSIWWIISKMNCSYTRPKVQLINFQLFELIFPFLHLLLKLYTATTLYN
jgi:hypothetical protein